MKSIFLEIFLSFLAFEVLLFTSASSEESILRFNCDEDCTRMLNAFITHAVKYTETAEDLRIQLNVTDEKLKNETEITEYLWIQLNATIEELQSKEILVNSMNQTIQKLERRLAEETDPLLILNGTNGCPVEGPSDIYKAKLQGLPAFEVPCSEEGWMTIQKRSDGSENFDRSWEDYKDGFGKVTREFFIGLEKLYLLTNSAPHELYIKIGRSGGSSSSATFDNFQIGNETESYVLKSLGVFNGTSGDFFTTSMNQKFSTFDRPGDYNMCSTNDQGGWWTNDCGYR
nr:fibrinogen-like protein 1 [Drosophila takahashii]